MGMKIPRLKFKRLRRKLPSRRDWIFLLLGGLVVFTGVKVMNRISMHQPLSPETSSVTIPWVPPTVKRWEEPIAEMSQKYQIDPNLLAIIMTMESGGYSKASSNADAHGLMQITPPTAKDIAAKYLQKPRTTYDLNDPRTNIEFGAAYLAYLRRTFGSADQGPNWNTTVELIAAGYNGGPGAAGSLKKGEGLRDMQTVSYSRDAYNMWRERHAAESPTFNRWMARGGSSLIEQAKAEPDPAR
jgi:soluble lytic murein transglycosylase